MPYGVQMCRLQIKQEHETTEITKYISSDAYLLVVWGISESKVLYADVLLVKYDKEFD
jgi:hypothetical protein